ncbi:MAG: zinc-ribbon domain-containing protein [Coriobacteriales bacterium]|nr:zinc-ribbon domain-containing protein [Coriobacteriales bacterium]
MYCSNCGATIKTGSKFCAQCGHPVLAPETPETQPAPAQVQAQGNAPAPATNGSPFLPVSGVAQKEDAPKQQPDKPSAAFQPAASTASSAEDQKHEASKPAPTAKAGGAGSPFLPLAPHIIPAKEEPSVFAKDMPSWSLEPPPAPIVRPWATKDRRVH